MVGGGLAAHQTLCLSLLAAQPEACCCCWGGLLMPGAGKETRLQCSCQDSHFINRKGPSPSAQQGWV